MPERCRRCPVDVQVWAAGEDFHAFLHHVAGLTTPLVGHLELSGTAQGKAAAAEAVAQIRLLQILADPSRVPTENPIALVSDMLHRAGVVFRNGEGIEGTLVIRIPRLRHQELVQLGRPWQHRSIPLTIPAAIGIAHRRGGTARAHCSGSLELAL